MNFQLQKRDHGSNGPKRNYDDEYKLTKNIFPGTSNLPKTDGTDDNKCDDTKSKLESKSNVPCKTNTEQSSSDGMEECTSWYSHQVLNYFSVFNLKGLRPQTVQSSVLYVKDRLVEKNQLFMTIWMGKFILRDTCYSKAIG